MKINLVNDWRNAHKWLSVQLCILGVVAESLWDYIPALQSPKIMIGFFVLIAIGRIIKQEENVVSPKK